MHAETRRARSVVAGVAEPDLPHAASSAGEGCSTMVQSGRDVDAPHDRDQVIRFDDVAIKFRCQEEAQQIQVAVPDVATTFLTPA